MDNPLASVTIGSTVDMAGQFHSTVLADNAQITQMVSRYEDHGSMRGQSDLAYTTSMNQASASMSGSYGVSGVEKMTAAVSAYWGRSSGQSGKSASVVFEIMMRAGFETVSFDALTPALLMGAMQAGPQQSAMQALQCYNLLMQALKGTDLVKGLSSPHDDVASQAVRDAYANWADAAQQFRSNYGEGVVVGIVWGGIGRAQLTIQDTASTSTWKYGGAAEFTYSGVGSSGSVGATYDASGSSSTSNVTAQCTTDTMGACAKPYTDKWGDLLDGKAFDAISKIAPLNIPGPTVQPTLPKPPDWIKPTPPKDADDQVKNVKKKDLDGVAKAAAYDRVKAVYEGQNPGGPAFSVRLDEFLKQAERAPGSGPVRDLGRKVRTNQLSTLSLLQGGHQAHLAVRGANPMLRAAAMTTGQASAAASQSGTENFVPIGVWISNWADLLPWLATGYPNGIEDTAAAELAIKFRMMTQDFLTLSRLYYYAANCDILIETEPNAAPGDFTQIADSFFAQYGTLTAGLDDPANYAEVAASAFGQLGDAARRIYTRWDEIKFLRSAELGLGVMGRDGTSLGMPTKPAFQQADFITYGRGYYMSAPAEHCSFNPTAGNYSAFAQFYKLMPLILPTSNKIVAIGPGGIMCTAGWQPGPVFARIVGGYVSPTDNLPYVTTPIEFTPNVNTSTLEGGGFTLYPVPFSAAQGISWKGQSCSTNVGADEDLNGKLKQLADDLDATKTAWSYSSNGLPDGWSASNPYSRLGVRKQYFGLQPEPAGAF